MSSTLRQRVFSGSGANLIGQCITIVTQIAALPIYLHFWSPEEYGRWLIISAIPSYLAVSDAGMMTAAANRMTMAMGAGQKGEANEAFQSGFVFMLCACGIALAVALPSIFVIGGVGGVGSTFTAGDRIALAILCMTVVATLFSGLADAIFKATSRYALGTTLGNCVRLAEWIGMMIGLCISGSYAAVAVGGLGARVIGLALIQRFADGPRHGIYWGTRDASLPLVRSLMKPALSFVAFPLASAVSFQGVTILVGQALGPGAVALFNTYRTLSRAAVQTTASFSHALWPEFSRAYGEGGVAAVKLLYRRTAPIGMVGSLALILGIYFLAPTILAYWTHERIPFDSALMLIMLLCALAASVAHIPRILLLSTNSHGALAIWCMLVSFASLILSVALVSVWATQGAAVAMLFSEMAMLAVCINRTRILLTLPPNDRRKLVAVT